MRVITLLVFGLIGCANDAQYLSRLSPQERAAYLEIKRERVALVAAAIGHGMQQFGESVSQSTTPIYYPNVRQYDSPMPTNWTAHVGPPIGGTDIYGTQY